MVYKNVQAIRNARGISKKKVAKHLGLTWQGYQRIENGEVRLDVERLRKISVLMGVNVEVFFSEELTSQFIKELENEAVRNEKEV